MISVWAIIAGISLGALGGALHLWVTWQRARSARKGAGFLLLSYPLGLLGPALAVLFAAVIAREAAFSVVVGLFAVRFVVLARFPEARPQ